MASRHHRTLLLGIAAALAVAGIVGGAVAAGAISGDRPGIGARGLGRSPAQVATAGDLIATYGYAGTGNPEQRLVARYPRVGHDLPWVLLVHGGSWVRGSTALVAPEARLLEAHGYVTFAMNYRLFVPGRPAVTYDDQITDVATALRWIRVRARLFGIDPLRGALYGNSAGGNLALQAALRPRSGVRAVLATAPIAQPQLLAPDSRGRAGIRADAAVVRLYGIERAMMGCDWTGRSTPPACRARWAAFALKYRTITASPPIFVYCGSLDAYSAQTQDRDFARQLHAKGASVIVDEIRGMGHTQNTFLDHAAAGLAFLAAHDRPVSARS